MLQAFKNILQRGRQGSAEVLGIEIKPTGVAIACLSISTGALSMYDYKACGAGEWQSCLNGLVKQHDLGGMLSFFTLHPKFYNMLLVDAPEVDDTELNDAVKWRVKDMISQSLDDVVVDVFRLPPAAYRGRMNMIYVSIVERLVVTSIVEAAESAGLELSAISINDLSVCQYGKRLEGAENKGLAFVTLGQSGGVVNLTESGLLYLSRSMDIGLSSLSTGQAVGEITLDTGDKADALALDIQRSLDYYESQLGMSGVTKIILFPTDEMLPKVAQDLKDKVSANIEVLNLSEVFSIDGDEESVKKLSFCFNAIGAALSGSELQQSVGKKGGARGAILATG